MTYDEFVEIYRPIKNPFNDNGYDGTMFETYGEELEFVRNTPSDRIWTLIDADGYLTIGDGYHFVNRMGYFITEVPCPADVSIEIILDEPRYQVSKFDGQCFQVTDTRNDLEVCTVKDYEITPGKWTCDAQARAEMIADALNCEAAEWEPKTEQVA